MRHVESIDRVKYARLVSTLESKRSELTFLQEEWRYARETTTRALALERATLKPELRDVPPAELLARLDADLRAEEDAAQLEAEREGAPHGYRPPGIKVRRDAFADIVQALAVVADLAARRDALAAELAPMTTLVSNLRQFVEGSGSPSFSVSTS